MPSTKIIPPQWMALALLIRYYLPYIFTGEHPTFDVLQPSMELASTKKPGRLMDRTDCLLNSI